MNDISNDERTEIEIIAINLSHASLANGLKTILNRELVLLKETEIGEGENREITLYNVALLTAATARIMDLAELEEFEKIK